MVHDLGGQSGFRLRRILNPGLCAVALGLLAGCEGCGPVKHPELRTVESVDLNRYAGTWYEIAHLPMRYQRNCSETTATYSLRGDGRISVLNRCRKGEKEDQARGVAWPVPGTANAQLKVRFVWPFSGDYWIVDLGKDYEYSVVGVPSRKYLWILSRTPEMDPRLLAGIKERAAAQGFDVSRLIYTDH